MLISISKTRLNFIVLNYLSWFKFENGAYVFVGLRFFMKKRKKAKFYSIVQHLSNAMIVCFQVYEELYGSQYGV